MKRHSASNILCIIAVVLVTSLCILLFTIDLFYEPKAINRPHPPKANPQAKSKPIHYDGIELNIIEDWSKRGELSSKLNIDQHLKPMSEKTPTSAPPSPTSKTPTPNTPQIPSVKPQGKAGITA